MSPRIDSESTGGTVRAAGPRACPSRTGAASGNGSPAALRLAALARLLGDDSPAVRTALRRELAAAGRPGRRLLERAAAGADARARSHARELLAELERGEVVRRLVRHVGRERVELEPALFLLGRLERPALDARPYLRALDAMGAAVRQRAARHASRPSRVRALVDYMAQELGYAGDPESYRHPDNVHLHRTIERKRGLPLTLCALYVSVARRAGIEAGILPLPGHVMLRLYGGSRNLIVDPFHGGETRSQVELMAYLAEHGLAFQTFWFRDAAGAALLQRQVHNLVQGLRSYGLRGQARAIAPVLRALETRGAAARG